MKRLSLASSAALVAPFLFAAQAAVAQQQPAAPAPALNDPTIVAIFDYANTSDIETGQLAVQRGSSQQVKDFGAMLARDHAAVRQQGRDLAARLHVTPTPPRGDQAARDHAAAMTRLRALHGAEFDRAFLQHEEAFHRAVISAVGTTLLPAIQNAELKAFVTSIAPAFQAHLLAAEQIERDLFPAAASH